MKHKIIIFFLFLSFIKLDSKSAVTYTFSGGRFGDCLIAYCHAFWAGYYFDLDFVYKPFAYSDQLALHIADQTYNADIEKKYKQTLHISHAFAHGIQSDTLYVVPYFPESHIEHQDPRCPFLFQVDWNNQGYINELRKRIKPRNLFALLDIPADCISVAVHIRKGTGWDIPQFAPTFEKLTEMHPLKWPPDSYYIMQIKRILALYPDQNIYIHIFTDHDNPLEIVEQYKTVIPDARITWGCRNQENRHNLNVLEDFFALTYFDCLIRNDSNFSFVSSKLVNYKVIIAPWDSKMIDGQIIINETLIETN